MSYKFTILCESHILPSMCLHVSYKITVLSEILITVAAFIWFLPSVCSQMYFKITIPADKLITQYPCAMIFIMLCLVATMNWVMHSVSSNVL